MIQAETDLANAEIFVDTSDPDGKSLAAQYLEDAEIAMNMGSPKRAILAAANATTSEAIDIAIDVIDPPDPRFVYPQTTVDLTLNISSTNSDAVQFNMTRYMVYGFTVGLTDDTAIVPSNGYINWTTSITTPLIGYCALVLNLHEFNTTSNLGSLVYGMGVLTNVGLHFEIELTVDGTYVTGQFAIQRGDSRFITSAIGFYDDGSGEQNTTISIRVDTIEGTIGPYLRGTEITFRGTFYDMFGGVFASPEVQYTVTTDPLDPTTTTTTGNGTPIQIDPLLLLGVTGGVIVVVIIVVFLNKRKGS
jgi:hypothetical protein